MFPTAQGVPRGKTDKYLQNYGVKKRTPAETTVTKEHPYKEWDISTTREKNKQKPHVLISAKGKNGV